MKHGTATLNVLSQEKLMSLHSCSQKPNQKKKKKSLPKTDPSVSGTPDLHESRVHVSLAV